MGISANQIRNGPAVVVMGMGDYEVADSIPIHMILIQLGFQFGYSPGDPTAQ
jgi:hypothetical protein